MKVRSIATLLLVAPMLIVSCSKETSFELPDDSTGTPVTPGNPSSGSGILTRIQQGHKGEDTVYHLSYDADKRLQVILDSTHGHAHIGMYDESGKLAGVDDDEDVFSIFTYTEDGRLATVEHYMGDYSEKDVFEYVNGVPAKRSHYTDGSLWRYYTYEVKDGNITSRFEYNKSGDYMGGVAYTFNTSDNIFRQFALFNVGNELGMEDVANLDTYFNKNLMATTTSEGVTYTYNFDNSQRLSSFQVKYPEMWLTWYLQY